MGRTHIRSILAALALAAGCGSGSDQLGGALTVGGTVASLSPGSSSPVLSVLWFYDDGMGDKHEGSANRPVNAPPQPFELSLDVPSRWLLDFDVLRALPTCSNNPSGARCRDPDETQLTGKGRLAIGTFLVFDDGNGDGQYSSKPQAETIRGMGPTYLLYAQDLDEQAIKELGELTLLNPQALRPGLNFARVRCRNQVGWTRRFDPFEIVSPASVTIESKEAYDARLRTGEICGNWT
jgi:hypothetical protein